VKGVTSRDRLLAGRRPQCRGGDQQPEQENAGDRHARRKVDRADCDQRRIRQSYWPTRNVKLLSVVWVSTDSTRQRTL
jgi:hypothetical protein